MKEVDTGPMELALKDLAKQMENPIPTAPVGTVVLWYDRADVREGNERAAIVTKVEGPGKVTVTIFPPHGMPIHKQACLHVSNPIHEQRHNAVSKNSGAWDYCHFSDFPKEHFDVHLDRLQVRADALRKQIADAKKPEAEERPKSPRQAKGKQATSTG